MTFVREEHVFDLVKEIGYNGIVSSDKNEFLNAIEEAPKSVEFSNLVSFLCNELRFLVDLDEYVNPMDTNEDSVPFILEVSSFLKETGCPYNSLIHGQASDRFATIEEKLLLLEYLISEIMAARILNENKPHKKLQLKLNETPHAADLRKILQILGFSRPPPNITMETLMQKLAKNVESAVKKAPIELLGNSLLNDKLSEKQWEKLEEVNKELEKDYTIRRETLLKRLDCTIQSFQWSDKTKGKEELFESVYEKKRKILRSEPEVDISDLLAAKEDLAIMEKTSSANVRKNTKSAINKIIIGQVPDRGGRTSEQAPPPPEMPSWQQRAPNPRGRGRNNDRGGFQRGDNNMNNRGRGFQQSGSYDTFNASGSSRNYNYNNSNTSGNFAFDSAGSYADNSNYYASNSQEHLEPKRKKTYEQFQPQKSTYADQYVEDDRQNQQYRPRSDNYNDNYQGRQSRGRSNYYRGGRGRGRGGGY